MATRPTLTTERLTLRPLTLDDAPDVARVANDDAVAVNVVTIPHPYTLAHAEDWIGKHQAWFDDGVGVEFGIFRRDAGDFIGATGLRMEAWCDRADVGYWITPPLWGQGYATEAARAVLGYAFDTLGLHRVHAHHLTRNEASGAVLRKIGMSHEGILRQHVKIRGVYEDIAWYGIMRSEHSRQPAK